MDPGALPAHSTPTPPRRAPPGVQSRPGPRPHLETGTCHVFRGGAGLMRSAGRGRLPSPRGGTQEPSTFASWRPHVTADCALLWQLKVKMRALVSWDPPCGLQAVPGPSVEGPGSREGFPSPVLFIGVTGGSGEGTWEEVPFCLVLCPLWRGLTAAPHLEALGLTLTCVRPSVVRTRTPTRGHSRAPGPPDGACGPWTLGGEGVHRVRDRPARGARVLGSRAQSLAMWLAWCARGEWGLWEERGRRARAPAVRPRGPSAG